MSATPTGREDGEIQAILRDSGFEEDADLRSTLEDLRALALEGPPEPRADLRALLTPGVSSLEPACRRRQRRMGVVVGAAVVGAMGLGAGAVAASSEDFRRSVGHTVVQFFPAADDATAPKKADVVSPSPADVPVLPMPSPAPSTTGAASPTEASPGQTARVTPRAPGNGITLPGDTRTKGRAVSSQLPDVPGTSPKLPSDPRTAVPTQPAPIEHPTPAKP
ncbi:hypothetical protein [Arthrobacter sp. ISL-28]|uniref:hypothetical protein n=1 Tax=Arthrobacter sp. ISL-28 TaxID=2819108 RepID=UPI001BE97711|nr:hypothetical protein [Arthrobacter sp. ISL-28]MBT2520175.1 hypothetical protein [Arthrobacter sp. ISL-28]